jgi:hypothetical protein
VHRDIGAENVERPSSQYCLNTRKQYAVLVLEFESSLDGQRLSLANVGEPHGDARDAIAGALDSVINYRLTAASLIGGELKNGVGWKGAVEFDRAADATRTRD